ncbi:dehydrogenase with different specificitie [Phyllosticta citrichinensis]
MRPNPRPLLPGKLAIVTGSSRGIGRAIALTYAYEGAAVVCADVSAAPHPRAGAEYRYLFDELAAAGADLLPTHETISKVGAKALFVSNAGVAPEGNDPRSIWELNFERMWEPTMKINANGVVLGTKHAAKQMISQEPSQSGDRGSIVNISSIYGVTGTGLQVSYNASKHAVVAITKTAALDLAEHRVHVNAIYVDTRLLDPILVDHDEVRTYLAKKHPFRGLGKPDDCLTRLAVYLGSDDNTWMTGTAIPVDGGFTAN